MGYIQTGSHTQYDIEYHIVWTTKYRYKVLQGRVAERLRELIRQGCEARGIKIVRGSIGKEHVHLLVSCPPTIAPSKLLQYLKGAPRKCYKTNFRI
jgi:putative transposase